VVGERDEHGLRAAWACRVDAVKYPWH
jgi:hypothetical protein